MIVSDHRSTHLSWDQDLDALPEQLLSFQEATERVLRILQDQLPLGLWAVTRREGDRQVFLGVRHGAAATDDAGAAPSRDGGYALQSGAVVAWEGSMCRAMVAGAPRATADAWAEADYAGTAPLLTWPVRTYLAAPITAGEGGLFGTLCGYGPGTADAELVERMAPVVHLLADMLGQVLLSEELLARAEDRQAHLYRLATRDHLTGVSTRAVFHDRLDHALDVHASGGRALSVLLIDVDDFKAVNDTHGHGAGDQLLSHLADRWAEEIRPGTTFARIGGDEFAVLIETGGSLDEVLGVVNRCLAEPLTVPGTGMRVGASVGIARLGAGERTPTAAALLSRADRALYSAKTAGKSRVCVAEG